MEEDDANPLATALREIKEETTLDLKSIELLRRGKPYTFTDDDVAREWSINPFAFRLKSPEEGGLGEAGIQIDWEHEGWEWHDPRQVNASEEFGGVPRLVDSLCRVWPEHDLGAAAGRVLTDGLEALRSDHESGARELAAHAVITLRNIISKMETPEDVDPGVWWANVRMAAWHLWKNGRESMDAAIISSLVVVLSRIEAALMEDRQPQGSDEKLQRVLAAIDDYLSTQDASVARLCDSFVDYIKEALPTQAQPQRSLSILTLSSSSTISSVLLKAAAALDVTVDLRILESRPLCEGVTLASKLIEAAGDQKIKITLYSDASAALAADGVDMILFGADRISAAGDVSNKTGTLPAVLSTRNVAPRAKVVLLSGVDKIARPQTTAEHVVEENDPDELMRAWDGAVKGADAIKKPPVQSAANSISVTVKNIYFEWVPAGLIDVYITDEGSWSAGDIKNRSDWINQEIDRFFTDL